MLVNKDEVAVAQAFSGSDALGSNERSHPETMGPLSAGTRDRQAGTEEEISITQVQEEVALWVSPQMRAVRDAIAEAALIDVTVLITGETGTGKDLVARAVHYLGHRRHGPFIKVNCTSVTGELLETELFGDSREPFAKASRAKMAIASRGTIFLDEIGDLRLDLQAKLLHVLEDGPFSRGGDSSTSKDSVRIVAATNHDLEASVAAGAFREDLFYRLNVIRIDVPPLRTRPQEIAPLAEYFVRRYASLFHQTGFTVPPEGMRRLKQYVFPGNVRELENTIKRMIVLRDLDPTGAPSVGGTRSEASPPRAVRAKDPASSLRYISQRAAHAAEQSAILGALQTTRWNRVKAAKLLNISYRSLLQKIKEAGLDGKSTTPELS